MAASCPPFLPSKSCTTGSKCRSIRCKTIKNLPVWTTDESESYGIFESPETWDSKVTEGLCVPCRVEAKALAHGVRSEFWLKLPTFFRLDEWASLEDSD